MKRLLFALALVAILLSLSLPSASAATLPVRFSLTGTLNSADATTGSLSVHVLSGSYNIQPYRGKDLTVKTGPDTIFLKYTPTGCIRVTFAELKPGDRLSLSGVVLADKTFYTQRVTIRR